MQIGLAPSKTPRSFQGGRYLVKRLLGQGATGTVFEVIDQELEGEVIALKVLHPQLLADSSSLERFRYQVLLTRQLSHPNIVQVFDFNHDEEGHHYITMEFVEGKSLREFLEHTPQGKLSFLEAQRLLSDVAAGLAYAHSLGIVHRDVKPSCLLVSYNGEVKLSDFGLAKGLEHSFGLTKTGEFLGSPAYSAPEQFRGDEVDVRADVYSFGILAFELLNGKLPFEGVTYLEQAEAHMRQTLPCLPTEESGVPIWFRDALRKCCEKERKKRYSSAGELKLLFEEHPLAQEEVLPEAMRFSFLRNSPNKRKVRRQQLIVGSAALFALFLLIVTCRQTSTRLWVGRWVLRAESILGVELTPLKAPFFVTVSPLRPKDFLSEVSEYESAKLNVPSYLDAGGDINITDENGNGLVHLAAQNGEVQTLAQLKAHGLDLNKQNSRGETPLLRAVRLRLTAAVLSLLSCGADPNICDSQQSCPLHEALEQNNPTAINGLVRHGANPIAPNALGQNILHLASWNHEMEILLSMLNEGTRVTWCLESRDREGLTPLMYAVLKLEPESGEDHSVRGTIGLLLDYGAKPSSRDNSGRTALIHAAISRNRAAIVYLLIRGANPDDRDGSGKSARDYARENGLEALFDNPVRHD